MRLRTEITISKSSLTLDPSLPVACVGSCFADNVAAKMESCGWEAVRPLGVLYNPLSIAGALRLCLVSDTPGQTFEESLFSHEGQVHSWLFDSRCSSALREECLQKFSEKSAAFSGALKRGHTLIVTFGTSYCYFLADMPDYVVANCHKVSDKNFIRRRISVEEITSCWRNLLKELKSRFSNLQVIFTVSPVRHTRDGLHCNNLSKAVLLLAVEELCKAFDFCTYFPAYEMLNDDLRDYRFYADDLVHPSSMAIEYIWQNFRAAYLDPNGIETLRQREKEIRLNNHRPIIK